MRALRADGIYTAAGALRGARCDGCGCVTFPSQSSCPRCLGGDMAEIDLPVEGSLWTWTVQGFAPKSPPYDPSLAATYAPYGVGYVDLGPVMVEARLTSSDPQRLEIGMLMRLLSADRSPDPWPWFEPVEGQS